MNSVSFFIRFKNLLIALLILTTFAMLELNLINSAPEIKRLESLQIDPNKKGTIVGWRELGQQKGASSAEKEHLLISHNKNTGWSLQNIASVKRIDAKTTKVDTRYLRRYALKDGDTIIFNTFKLTVKQASNGKLILVNPESKETAKWNGSELLINQKSGFPACEREGLRRILGSFSDKFHWYIRHSNPQQALRLFSIGGQVHCTSRWNQKDLQPDSARFYWQNEKFWIGPGREPSRVLIQTKNKIKDLKKLALNLTGEEGTIRRIILGRTYYTLNTIASNNPKKLLLTPVLNQQVFPTLKPDDFNESKSDTERSEQLQKIQDREKQRIKDMADNGLVASYKTHSWIGESLIAQPQRKLSLILLVILAAVGLVSVITIHKWKRTIHGNNNLRVLLVTMTLTLILSWAAFAWKGELNTTLAILFISTVWTSLLLTFTDKLQNTSKWLWYIALILGGIGTLTLTQLAAGAENTRWLRYIANNVFVLTILSNFIAFLSLIPIQALNGLFLVFLHKPNPIIRILRWLGLTVAVSLLVLQFAIGTEQGIFGIQPVEIAKLIIVIITAQALWHLTMLRTIHSRYYRDNPKARILFFMWVLFAFLIVSLLIAVGVHDYSPTLIVMALMAAYLWKAIPHPIRNTPSKTIAMRSFWVLLPLAIVLATGYWLYQNPPDYDSIIPQAERLRIWINPEQYPEAASQLLKSLDRVGQGAWLGHSGFGSNKISMAIPAVQDDFIAAFLLNRFGAFTGLILITAQLLWLFILFSIANKLSQPQKNQTLFATHNIIGNIIFGLAWIHLLHWLISWSNVLGLLPIMGQPMTWLSAGNSHLLAIGAVTLVLGIVGSWVSEKE